MARFILRLLLILGLLPVIAFGQGSTGRRPSDLNTVVTHTVSESIISVNVNIGELVLKNFDGKPHTLKVSKDTTFPSAGKSISLRDLHPGQRVRVTYRAADSTALEIRVLEP
jgi:hypothetical protein